MRVLVPICDNIQAKYLTDGYVSEKATGGLLQHQNNKAYYFILFYFPTRANECIKMEWTVFFNYKGTTEELL